MPNQGEGRPEERMLVGCHFLPDDLDYLVKSTPEFLGQYRRDKPYLLRLSTLLDYILECHRNTPGVCIVQLDLCCAPASSNRHAPLGLFEGAEKVHHQQSRCFVADAPQSAKERRCAGGKNGVRESQHVIADGLLAEAADAGFENDQGDLAVEPGQVENAERWLENQ